MSYQRPALDLTDPDVQNALKCMSPRSRRRAVAEARGETSVAEGSHAGGPCPAVCLATLSGWSYQRSFEHLCSFGYRGTGMQMGPIRAAYAAVFGEPTLDKKPPRLTVAQSAGAYMGGKSGAIANARHIMPVLNGRVLNAGFGNHLNRVCTDVLVYNIT